jgi:hypothetical protein
LRMLTTLCKGFSIHSGKLHKSPPSLTKN